MVALNLRAARHDGNSRISFSGVKSPSSAVIVKVILEYPLNDALFHDISDAVFNFRFALL